MKTILFLLTVLSLSACAENFLDVKRESSLVVPNAVEDYTGLMDNLLMYQGLATELATYGADEFTVGDGMLSTLTQPLERNAYIWADDVYERRTVNDWDKSYQRILYCNLALEGLEKIRNENDVAWKNAKGMALFHRAYNFFLLNQEFGQMYSVENANTALGIPLRLESDVTMPSKRATVAETYMQIVSDLEKSAELLPELPIVKQRPSKQATYALLSRVYLIMENYEQSASFAKQCIEMGNGLMDYNSIDLSQSILFPTDPLENKEIILYAMMQPSTLLRNRYSMEPELLGLYSENDLRKEVYFIENTDGRILFRGTYLGQTGTNFVGLALDEVYLTYIECLIRLNEASRASTVLKDYLKTRYKEVSKLEISEDSSVRLLEYVLEERRKQLVFRGVRWMDLRRLNKDTRFAETLVRQIDGEVYRLTPNSSRYVWPLPDEPVEYGGLVQNER